MDGTTPRKINSSMNNSGHESIINISDSVYSSQDTTLDVSRTRGNDFDESCFIIDVEPDRKSLNPHNFYTFANEDVERREHSSYKDENNQEEHDTASDKVLCSNSAEELLNNDDILLISTKNPGVSSCSEESSSSASSNFESSNSRGSVVNEVSPQHATTFNNVFNQTKPNKFIDFSGSSGNKRPIDDKYGPNKHFKSSAQSNKQNWDEYKKSMALKKQSFESNKSCSEESNTSSKPLKESTTNDSCISVDSDSDVEFVDSFNPADKLIELSDSEDSVVIQQVQQEPPSLILLPKTKKTNKKNAKKKVGQAKSTLSKKKKVKKTDQGKQSGKKVTKTPLENLPLRPIVIDGCNVGMGHSRSKKLSVEGIKICYDYFQSRGHVVKVFLPQWKKFNPNTSNSEMLNKMEHEGIVVFTPSRKVDGQHISSYDDRFILEYASLTGAIVITRDNYRDLYQEKEEFRDTIKNRLLQYTFVDNLIMFPEDPLGRTGPHLQEFLRFPSEPEKKS